MNLVINSQFRPFTYDEMVKPLVQYKEAYEKVEQDYSDLVAQTEMWKDIANREKSPIAYEMYNRYSTDLAAITEDFSKGMNMNNRSALLGMKRRYVQDITPIANAHQRKTALEEEQRKAELNNPTMMWQRRVSEMSLDDFIKNTSLDYGKSFSGALLTQQVATKATALAKELRDSGEIGQKARLKLQQILPYQYRYLEQRGFSSDEVLKAISQDPNANEILTNIVESTLQSSGIADWADDATMKRARAYANEGLWNAIGQSEYKQIADQAGLTRLQYGLKSAQQDLSNRISHGNIPIDIHHLISPNQEGAEGQKLVNSLRARLGLSGHLNGKYAKTVDLKGLKVGGSDVYTYKFKNKDGGTTVRLFDDKGRLLSRESVVAQASSTMSKEGLGKWYDSLYNDIKTNFTSDNGNWTVNGLSKQMLSITEGNGAYNMGAMRINFGTTNNQKVLESLLPQLTNGDMTNIREISRFDKSGKITTGNRAEYNTFIDKDNKITGTPMFYASPNVNTDGLIMQFNGKTYLIPRDKLGSLGEQLFSINIPELQKANNLKQQLISQYGENAYYNSQEGAELEQIINDYGASYLRAASTSLGYSYNLPTYNIKEND